MAAFIGGALRAVTSFPLAVSDSHLQAIYIVVDVFLLAGVLGFYELCYEDLGKTGGFVFALALIGMLLIRSSRAIPGLDLYPSGALIFAVAISTLCLIGWRARKLAAWIPAALSGSVIVGMSSQVWPGRSWLFVASGVMFGTAFAAMGLATLEGSRL
jgi:hypothetical protein